MSTSAGSHNLDSIPYDMLYQVVCSLDCDDYVNLSRTNKALNAVLRDESIAKNLINV